MTGERIAVFGSAELRIRLIWSTGTFFRLSMMSCAGIFTLRGEYIFQLFDQRRQVFRHYTPDDFRINVEISAAYLFAVPR